MIRTYLIPLLAIAGMAMAVYTVVQGSKPAPVQPPVVEPPRSPFSAAVAGSGLVEASSQNIAVGTAVPGVAAEVLAQVGDEVKKGQPLFRIDARELQAELAAREAALKVAESTLAKWRLGTRPEEIPPVRARVAEAEANLADMKSQLDFIERVKDNRAVSEDETMRRRHAVAMAEARAAEAKSQLALLEAGNWAPDIAIYEAQVAREKAQVEATRIEIDRRTIKSPIDGKVLQVNLRVGEFAQAGPLTTPLMVVGAVRPLHVRVDIDENDAWRVKAGARAKAYIRGNKDIEVELRFVRFEPFVIPKRSLTGESTERVDTRVLQVLYAFDPADKPIYVGQQMDAYIENEPTTPAKAGS